MTRAELEAQGREIEEARAALERARMELREISKTLRRSRRVDRWAIPQLRAAGKIR
jgi:hypothetical protein